MNTAKPYNRTETVRALRALSQEARGVLAERQMTTSLALEIEHCIELAEKQINGLSLKKMHKTLLYLRVVLDKTVVDVDKTSVADLQRLVRRQLITYRQLTAIFLNRINYYNNYGVKLNAIIALNNNALEEAQQCDEAVAKYRNLAHGIFGMPVLIKDNIDTARADGMATTMGSIALANNFAQEDAFIVKRLRDQGAIILGKTNLSEFAKFMTDGVRRANGRIEPMPQGYSSLGGQVHNPYRHSISPGGSSSGSAVAAAAALSVLTVGTEAAGSILLPASANSVVGMKPSVGLVSRQGILAAKTASAGPITRCVEDAAYLLEAMKGYDPEDGVFPSLHEWQENTTHYPDCLDKNALEGKRIGIYELPNPNTRPDEVEALKNTIITLRSLGAEVVYAKNGEGLIEELETDKPADIRDRQALTDDFTYRLKQYLQNMPDKRVSMDKTPIASIRDIVEYNRCYPELLHYGQTILELCAGYMPTGKDIPAPGREWAKKAMERVFAEYKLDAMLSINAGAATLGAKAGYPGMVIPAGYGEDEEQHPLSVLLNVPTFQDGKLLGMCYALEQATKARRTPGMADKRLLQELLEELDAMGAWSDVYNKALTVYESNFSTQAQVDYASESLLYLLM